MADVKISALPLASTPLAGTEVLPIVQSATTDQVSVANLTAGRAVSAASLTLTTTPLAVGSGGTGSNAFTANYIPYSNGTILTSSANLTFDGTTLAYSGSANAQRWITLRNTDAGSSASGGLLFGNDGNAAYGALYINSSTNTGIGAANGLNIGTYGAYPLTFFTSATGRMVLDSAGNLGLGVTPSAWITGGGLKAFQFGASGALVGADFSSSDRRVILSNNFYYNSSTGNDTYINAGAATRYQQSAGQHIWSYAGSGSAGGTITFTPAMTLDASGNLLVGTASNSGRLTVFSSGSADNICGQLGGSNNSYSNFVGKNVSSSVTFYVLGTGTIASTSTTITAISDRRLKENIVNLDVGLDALLALKPRKFDWKTGKGKDIKGDRGWIADEFQQVFPDLIDEWKDTSPEGEEPYKAVRPDLMPVVVKAIQELAAKVQALEAKVA